MDGSVRAMSTASVVGRTAGAWCPKEDICVHVGCRPQQGVTAQAREENQRPRNSTEQNTIPDSELGPLPLKDIVGATVKASVETRFDGSVSLLIS